MAEEDFFTAEFAENDDFTRILTEVLEA